METSNSSPKSFRWILFVIVLFILLSLFFYKHYYEGFVFFIKITVSAIPGLIIAYIVSLGLHRKEIPEFNKWLVYILSFAVPLVATYFLLGGKINIWIGKIETFMYNLFLVIIFLSTLLLTIIRRK